MTKECTGGMGTEERGAREKREGAPMDRWRCLNLALVSSQCSVMNCINLLFNSPLIYFTAGLYAVCKRSIEFPLYHSPASLGHIKWKNALSYKLEVGPLGGRHSPAPHCTLTTACTRIGGLPLGSRCRVGGQGIRGDPPEDMKNKY